MKEGTGGDPFSDDTGDDQLSGDGPATDNEGIETASASASEPANDSPPVSKEADNTNQDDDGLPWAVQRNSVKSSREMVQFYLREFVQERETDFQREVEAKTGYDTYLTDVREAAYLVAMEHPEEVAELLDEWGCEYV